MSNLYRHGGGSLRGQRGDDCGVDLGLKECIRHPKKKMEMWPGVGVGVGVGVAVAGVKLNNNTATYNTKRTEILEFETRRIFA